MTPLQRDYAPLLIAAIFVTQGAPASQNKQADTVTVDGATQPSQIPEWLAWEYSFTLLKQWQGKDSGFTHDLREALSAGEFELLVDHDNLSDNKVPYPESYAEFKGKTWNEKVIRFDPPRLLETTFQGGNNGTVTYELLPQGDGTRLVVTHAGIVSGTGARSGARTVSGCGSKVSGTTARPAASARRRASLSARDGCSGSSAGGPSAGSRTLSSHSSLSRRAAASASRRARSACSARSLNSGSVTSARSGSSSGAGGRAAERFRPKPK